MESDLRPLVWTNAADAVSALAARAGVGTRASVAPSATITEAAAVVGLDAEEVTSTYAEVDSVVRRAAPAVVRVVGGGVLALLRAGHRSSVVMAPDGSARTVDTTVVSSTLCESVDAQRGAEADRLLAEAEVPPVRRPRARAALLREILVGTPVAGLWRLRLPAGASFPAHLGAAGIPRRAGALVALFAAQYATWIASWWILGRWVMGGGLGFDWLLAWAALLLALVPMRLLATWLQGRVAIVGGALLKARLLAGALGSDPDDVRGDGAGRLLGRVLESEAVESLALGGGVLGLVASLELAAAAFVLAAAPSGGVLLGLLVAWIAAGAVLSRSYLSARRSWTDARLGMTHALVERMTGHRTRLAQEAPERRHEGEAESLASYEASSTRMDGAATLLSAIPRAWLVTGACVMAPVFGSGGAAVAIGGVLLAFRALQRGVAGLADLATAAIAWREVAPLFRAAARPAEAALAVGGENAVVEARDVVFRHRGRPTPVLAGASLTMRQGDRVLLEGPSGAGKSTFAAILAGLRRPESGAVVVAREGMRIASVPQFHENHLMTGSFLFNLLVGRAWPAGADDEREAASLCAELGLGPLLASMPAGIQQVVGEGGWQLSHGERSRLYLARALLQGADLLLLDESFAALDPESLALAMRCVMRRAPTVLVIAHP